LAIVILIVAVVLFLLWLKLFPATCSDGKQNHGEEGIDCGGPCPNECLGDVRDINVLWAKALSLKNGRYDLIAMLENPNINIVAESLEYEFYIYDKNNNAIGRREGKTFVNNFGEFLIFEPMVDFHLSVPNNVILKIKNISWKKRDIPKLQIVISKKDFTNTPFPKLDIFLVNKSPTKTPELFVYPVIYDKDKNAFAASVTKIDGLDFNEEREVIFTWPKSFDKDPDSYDIFFKPVF